MEKMNVSYFIKINKKKYPVFRTPVSEDQLQKLLINGKYPIFYIHDMKSNKIKKYDFSGNLPKRQSIEFDISYSTIAKGVFTGVLCVWAYRLLNAKPLARFKGISYKEMIKNDKKKKKVESPNNVSKSSNGWVIEEIN